jgi:CO/xanthine dehydrogenase Mo-binding subunit
MTGLLHEKEFSRKSFVKSGGALIVGFSIAGAALAGRASADRGNEPGNPFGSDPIDPNQVDSWIVVNADNTALIKSGSIHQGTGSTTGIMMIAAEELNMNFSQVIPAWDDTSVAPNTGTMGASNTICGGAGRGTRAACAYASQALLGLASTRLGVPVANLTVKGGVVSGGGKSVTYGDLLAGKLFNVTLPDSYDLDNAMAYPFFGGLGVGQAPAKPASQYTIVGTTLPRLDIPDIVSGNFTYIQNVRVPGMLHGRVVRPRGQMVYGFGAPVVSVDAKSIAHLPGAQVVRVGDFVGVVAPHEYDAIQAAGELKVKWANPPKTLPGSGNMFGAFRALDAAGQSESTPYDQDTNAYLNWFDDAAINTGNVDSALASAAHTVSASYHWPMNVHAPMGPACVICDVTSQGVRVLSGTQGAYQTQGAVAQALNLPADQVRVTAFPMGGAFGSSPYDDAAMAAALMSNAVGAPVRVQLMRWDDIGWDNYGPGTLIDIRGGIDGKGNIVGYDFTQFYPQYMDGNSSSGELAGALQPSSYLSGQYYAGRPYNIANTRYLAKTIPLVGNWIKAAWMRMGSGPLATFAGEQMVDELAHAAKMDPVAFRLQNVSQGLPHDPMLAVLHAVTKAANWQPAVAASKLSDANVVSGRGFAWSYAQGTSGNAAIADIEVNKQTGKVTVKHIYQAYSPGFVVNPHLVENQMVGGITQIVSRVLVEQLVWNRTNVTSLDFATYPILRFVDAPKVTAIPVTHQEMDAAGTGEPVTATPPAAIANAFFDATGVRMRSAPFTPTRIRAALKAAGVA